MRKQKQQLTAAEKAEKRRRRNEYITVFINGKQKRAKRLPTIDGMDVDEFIQGNADPIWLHGSTWTTSSYRIMPRTLLAIRRDALLRRFRSFLWLLAVTKPVKNLPPLLLSFGN